MFENKCKRGRGRPILKLKFKVVAEVADVNIDLNRDRFQKGFRYLGVSDGTPT